MCALSNYYIVMGKLYSCGSGMVLVALSFWLLIFGAAVTNGYPKEDLVVKLPGQPDVPFKQYAGYVDVDGKAGRSLFYYFVEAEEDPHHKPLALWLNGGPGCSSVGGGAFTELGPFFPTGDGRGLRRNADSWNKVSNLLFVESPAGVGWSYSNRTADYTLGDDETAQDMLRFLLRWYAKFPEFKNRSLFLTGESYAGHYIPQLTSLLLDYNQKSNKSFKFNIKGVAIGNPLLRLDRDVAATYEFYWSHGMISDDMHQRIQDNCDFEDHNQSWFCQQFLNMANDEANNHIDPYDVILDVCYPDIVEQELRLHKIVTHRSVGVDVCIEEEIKFYFNLPEVQKALHANRTNLPYPWTMCSNILNYSEADQDRNILPLLQQIVEHNITLLVYSGDQDSVVPLIGTRALMRELAKDLNLIAEVDYNYKPWFHNGQVGGWQIGYGRFLTYVTVRGASHMVPFAQPARSLNLFSSFVSGKRLPIKSNS